jgi:hypothetical protein
MYHSVHPSMAMASYSELAQNNGSAHAVSATQMDYAATPDATDQSSTELNSTVQNARITLTSLPNEVRISDYL